MKIKRGDLITILKNRLTYMFRLQLIMVSVLGISLTTFVQGADTISKKEQEEVIKKICTYLEDNYVFPETGKELNTQISKNSKDGKYSKLTSPTDFAYQLNEDLMDISEDKHLKVVYDPDWIKQIKQQEQEQDVYLTKEMIEEEKRNNFGFKELRILAGNIGYLDLRIFFHAKYAGETAVSAMNFFSNCDALIIDLRNNGGGWGEMVAFLCSYFVYGDTTVLLSTGYSRPEDEYFQSWSMPYVPGKTMPNIPLYILTSKSTFSAAEEFCYNLKYLKRATIIGETTRGGAHPISPKVLNDNFILILPEWRSINPITGTNWEGVGVKPHIEIPANEALNVAHLAALEKLLTRAQNEGDKFGYQWHLDGLKAKINPAAVDSSTLLSYVGKYGSRNITFENGILYYQRGDRSKRKMIPMTQDLFMIEDIDQLRVKFITEDGHVKSLIAMYSDGAVVESTKENEKH